MELLGGRRRHVAATVVLALVLSVSLPSRAQDSGASAEAPAQQAAPPSEASDDPNVARARDAFEVGTRLAHEGQWVEALAAYERSARLRPHPVTTYNIGYCERALGRYTRARKMLKLALSEHESKSGGALPDDLLALAKTYLAEVEQRVVHATVSVRPASSTLSVDGRPLETSDSSGDRAALVAGTRDSGKPEAVPQQSFELLIDPGRHVFVLAQPGAPDTVVSETFAAGSAPTLELVARESAGERPANTAVRAAPKGPDYTLPILSYGVGAAGIAVGSVFGIATLNKGADLDSKCPNKSCPSSDKPEIDTANRYAMVSTIGFGIGILGVGAGTYLLLTAKAPSEKKLPEKTAHVRPWVGVGRAGLAGSF